MIRFLDSALPRLPDRRATSGPASSLSIVERTGLRNNPVAQVRKLRIPSFGKDLCQHEAHFRQEHQTSKGDPLRNDEEFPNVWAWAWNGPDQTPTLHLENLTFELLSPALRKYD